MLRFAGYGFFAIAVDIRGRLGADGSRDASGREIHDLYDALTQARAMFPALVSPTQASIVGYSAGGGNALAAACKFPDAWGVVVSHFGMSDYGRNNPNGWYYNNGGAYTAEIAASVGDTPANVPNNYYARDATAAIQNYTGGTVYLYHDQADAVVPYVHSTRIKDALDTASLTNYSYNVTNVGDPIRFTHGYPEGVADLITAEPTWSAAALAAPAWAVPASGTVTVIGYIVTKRFSIWLNANGTATTGIDAAATVVYNTATDTYTVTPLTGAIDVSITQGSKTGSDTNINAETAIVVT
jgi:pimeloyl-ACP methyl ester carboxylesterase